MTVEFKNLAWQCLPKEARDEMRRTYKYQCRNIDYNRGFNDALEEIFGGHNLTSDTEPTELLFVEREKLVNICKDAPINIEQSVLYELFGDKCLPDKTEPKPKFNKGAKIKLNCRDSKGDVWDAIMDGRIATISDIYTNAQGVIMYKFEEGIRDFGEHCLEPYTEPEQPSVQSEPKFKVGDRMYIKYINMVGTIDMVMGYNEEEDGIFYHLKIEPKGVATAREENLQPYTETEAKRKETQNLSQLDKQSIETKDNMEEKELNRKALYDAFCELESASAKVRKALIQYEAV